MSPRSSLLFSDSVRVRVFLSNPNNGDGGKNEQYSCLYGAARRDDLVFRGGRFSLCQWRD